MEVPAVNTPATPDQMLEALGRAWIRAYQQYPLRQTIQVLMSQWQIETGGVHMFCWNVGNTMGHGAANVMALHTHEFIDGQMVPRVSHFAAFDSLDAGCDDQISFLAQHYPACIEAAKSGDPVAFATAAHVHHYMTAPLASYVAGMHSAFASFQHLAPAPWEQELQSQLDAAAVVPDPA